MTNRLPRLTPLLAVVYLSLPAGCADVASVGSHEADVEANAPQQNGMPAGQPTSAPPPAPPAEAEPKAPGEPFKFVSYNVGGLADIIAAGSPSKLMPLISPLLNPYDLVVVQEDFEYHDELVSKLTHPFKVKPGKATFPKLYGDGLAIFSRMTTNHVFKEEWRKCNGTVGSKNDCLAEKGFRRTAVTIAPNVEIDVYSLHMDAGRGGDDAKARDAQAVQLAAYLNLHSKDRPVIVAGDTNMKASDEASTLRLLELTSLRDTCRELKCPQPELHDRVFIRDGWGVKLTPANWRVETSFKTEGGKPLSDHEPVAVDISWSETGVVATTAPPPGSGGFTLEGKLHLKNGTGVCAQAPSVLLGTAACSAAASQLFAVYKMPDGSFELCVPETLRVANAGTASAEYRAMCLARTGDTELNIVATTLSKSSASGFGAEPGHIIAEAGGILGWRDSVRKLTRDSEGVVVLGKHSGNPDQQWSPY